MKHNKVVSGFLACWMALTGPIASAADATQVGASLGAAMGQSARQALKNESAFRQQADDQLGISAVTSKGRPGGESSVSMQRTQEKPLPCSEGAELGLAGTIVRINACEKDAGGSITRLEVSLCDGASYGRSCYADDHVGFTPQQRLTLGKGNTTSFSGAPLNSTYGVSAWCDPDGKCLLRVAASHSGSFGQENERKLADAAVQSAADHVLHSLAGIRSDGEFQRLQGESQVYADHFPTQVQSLFAEGVIRALNGNSLEMGIPEDCDAGMTSRSCNVDIPTKVIVCESGRRECQVTREVVEKTCKQVGQTTTINYRLDSNGYRGAQVRLTQFEAIRSVSVYVKHSKSSCTLGSSFGVKDENVLWVSDGCRATFTISGVQGWNDECNIHRQRVPGTYDPDDLPSHPNLNDVAECYPTTELCARTGLGGGCIERELSFTCYGDPVNSCDTDELLDLGWRHVDTTNHIYPSFTGYSDMLPIRWTEVWAGSELHCPDDPGFGCGEAFDITDGAAKKRCYTGPTPSCGPSNGYLADRECLSIQDGVCVREQQRWMTGSTAACESYGMEAAKVPLNEGAFGKALAASALLDQIAEHGAFGADGQFRLFVGKSHDCRELTSNFHNLIRAYSAIITVVATYFGGALGAALAGAATGAGMSVLDAQYCCKADPAKINPSASFGYCSQDDVDLAIARKSARAVQVTPGSIPTNNTFCLSYATMLPSAPAKGSSARADQICNHWTRPWSIANKQIQVDRYQRWCEFDSMLARIIQEQGREQLNVLAATNVGGAQTRAVSFPYFGAGGWTAPVSVNGNQLRFWQWDKACSDPETQSESAMKDPMQCPTDPDVFVAVCSTGSCGALPADPLYYYEADWEIHQVRAENHGLQALNRYVVLDGGCFEDGGCDYRVHAYQAGRGGQLRIPVDMDWPLRGYEHGWDQRLWSHNNVHFRPYIHPIDTENPKPRLQMCVGAYEDCDAKGRWIEVTVPNPVTSLEHEISTTPKVTLLGECRDDMCHYRATVHVKLTAKPWYTYSQQRYETCMAKALGSCISRARTTHSREYVPHCEGFTLDEFLALDLSRMDLSEYIDTLSTEAKKEFMKQWQE